MLCLHLRPGCVQVPVPISPLAHPVDVGDDATDDAQAYKSTADAEEPEKPEGHRRCALVVVGAAVIHAAGITAVRVVSAPGALYCWQANTGADLSI